MANAVQSSVEQLVVNPLDEEALSAVETAYSAAGRWEELLRVLSDLVPRVDGSKAIGLLQKGAEICLKPLGATKRAEVFLKRAQSLAPTDPETLKALRRLYLSQNDFEQGLPIYEKELTRTPDARARALGWVEIARLYGERLHDANKALVSLRQAQRADATLALIYRTAAQLYDKQGAFAEAHAEYMKELEAAVEVDEAVADVLEHAQRLLRRPRFHELCKQAIEAVQPRAL
mgnify:CR=1 FL=1